MPSKNSISGLLKSGGGEKNPILPKTPEPEAGGGTAVVRSPRKSRKIGRPKKAKVEKRDFKITLSLTQAEGEKILEKAGLADKATYLYDFLKKKGAFE